MQGSWNGRIKWISVPRILTAETPAALRSGTVASYLHLGAQVAGTEQDSGQGLGVVRTVAVVGSRRVLDLDNTLWFSRSLPNCKLAEAGLSFHRFEWGQSVLASTTF